METLFGQGFIQKAEGEKYVSYLFEDDRLFSPLDFRMLLNQSEEELLKCVKVIFNGRTKLIYMTEGYRRLDQALPYAKASGFLQIAKNLVAAVIYLRENGFLKCTRLDLETDRIFVDWKTHGVRLVYLPVNDEQNTMQEAEFDNQLRRRLFEWRTGISSNDSLESDDFFRKLGDYQYQLKDIYSIFCKEGCKEKSSFGKREDDRLILQSVGGADNMRFEVEADEYLLGKSAVSVQGTVTGSPRVSRRHCRISQFKGMFYATDLGSMNGTFLDGNRLLPDQPYALADGMILKLADISFRVTITGSNEK